MSRRNGYPPKVRKDDDAREMREVSAASPHHMTPRLTLGLPLSKAQRSGPITAEVGGSSPPRPTTVTRRLSALFGDQMLVSAGPDGATWAQIVVDSLAT